MKATVLQKLIPPVLAAVVVMSHLTVNVAAPPTPEEAQRMAEEQRRLVAEHRASQEKKLSRIRADSLCLAGTDTAYSTLTRLYEEFRRGRSRGPRQILYQGGGTDIGIANLTGGHAQAALIRRVLKPKEQAKLAWRRLLENRSVHRDNVRWKLARHLRANGMTEEAIVVMESAEGEFAKNLGKRWRAALTKAKERPEPSTRPSTRPALEASIAPPRETQCVLIR